MKYLLATIIEELQADSNITSGLADNYAWDDPAHELEASKENSILPSSQVTQEMNRMFMTVDVAGDTALGRSRLALLFIRVYDNSDLNIGFRLRSLADKVIDTLDTKHYSSNDEDTSESYEIEYTRSQSPRIDEALNLRFIEIEFSVISV